MTKKSNLWAVAALATVGGCAVLPPAGPSVMVLPGNGKTFEQFRTDDAVCRQFSEAQVAGVAPGQAALGSAQASAALGTVLGAGLGAAAGGGRGAAIGAGSGLLLGTLTGSDAGAASAGAVQRRYDIAYIQCMYAKGNQVPMSGGLASAPGARAYPPTPPDYYPPPPR